MGEESVIHRTTGSLLLSPVSDIVGVPLDQVGSLLYGDGNNAIACVEGNVGLISIFFSPEIVVGCESAVLWRFSVAVVTITVINITVEECF